MMNAGDPEMIFKLMQAHGIQYPASSIRIQIPEAKKVLAGYFDYFMNLQNTRFLWQPEYEKVANWLCDNHKRGLLLYGDCGRGKSILTRYVLPAILLKYYRKVVTVYDMQELNREPDSARAKHLLSLDDIGTEEISNIYGNKRQIFSEIMDATEKQGKLVIISTNLNKSGLIEKYGYRTYDRIIATTQRIEFKGESLRR